MAVSPFEMLSTISDIRKRHATYFTSKHFYFVMDYKYVLS